MGASSSISNENNIIAAEIDSGKRLESFKFEKPSITQKPITIRVPNQATDNTTYENSDDEIPVVSTTLPLSPPVTNLLKRQRSIVKDDGKKSFTIQTEDYRDKLLPSIQRTNSMISVQFLSEQQSSSSETPASPTSNRCSHNESFANTLKNMQKRSSVNLFGNMPEEIGSPVKPFKRQTSSNTIVKNQDGTAINILNGNDGSTSTSNSTVTTRCIYCCSYCCQEFITEELFQEHCQTSKLHQIRVLDREATLHVQQQLQNIASGKSQ